MRGGIAHGNRRFIDAACPVLRAGAPWRGLPPPYGGWKNTRRRFCRRRDNGARGALREQPVGGFGREWPTTGAGHVKAHPRAAGAGGGDRAMSLTKGGTAPSHIWPWARLACRSGP
ncbi:MAG: hypothetical protein HY777_10155, partial [Betaproteobacteria bacterium]|nr:hypothetical protein [Betaproteobacteria bacterium]